MPTIFYWYSATPVNTLINNKLCNPMIRKGVDGEGV